MGGVCASFLKGVGGFVCFSAVPGEVTAIPALSQKHIHLCEKRRPLNSDERPRGLRCTGRQDCTLTSVQTQHKPCQSQTEGERFGGRDKGGRKERKKRKKLYSFLQEREANSKDWIQEGKHFHYYTIIVNMWIFEILIMYLLHLLIIWTSVVSMLDWPLY